MAGPARTRAGWSRLSPEGAPTCHGRFRHDVSGWEVRHCGHQTALWPYVVYGPTLGDRGVVSYDGRGFKTLVVAMDVAERCAAGELKVVDRGALTVDVSALGVELAGLREARPGATA